MDKPIVSVVLGSFQRRRFIEKTLDTVRSELIGVPHEIIIIDGGSTDGSVQWLSKQKDVLLILQHNRGTWRGSTIKRRSWSYFMNLGFRCAQGKYICMLSDDCLVIPGAIKNGIDYAEKAIASMRKIGAVAFYWRNWPEQKNYWVGITWGNTMFVNHGLYLNTALQEVGYATDNEYLFYHADGDICLKLFQAGYECIDSPTSFIEHYTHANENVRKSNNFSQKNDWEFYTKKWSHFGMPKQDWIYSQFTDVHSTANRFLGIKEVQINILVKKIYFLASSLLVSLGVRAKH